MAEEKKLSIDISIPVYNEGSNIVNTLKTLDGELKKIAGADFKINIIYDFEEDNTLPVIEKIKKDIFTPLQLVKNNTRGVVYALKTGFECSTADYVLVTMADMSDDYRILPELVRYAAEGYDVICPSRYMKGGKLYGGPFLKQLLSRLAGVSMHLLARIPTNDITNSYKLYKLSAVKGLKLESTGGFEIGMEITAKVFRAGGRIVELPTEWRDRTEGKSNFKLFKWLPKYLKWYFYSLKGIFVKSK